MIDLTICTLRDNLLGPINNLIPPQIHQSIILLVTIVKFMICNIFAKLMYYAIM